VYGSRTHTLGGGLDGGVRKKGTQVWAVVCRHRVFTGVYSEECKLVYTECMQTVIEACGV
jgi:hypothetical protein